MDENKYNNLSYQDYCAECKIHFNETKMMEVEFSLDLENFPNKRS